MNERLLFRPIILTIFSLYLTVCMSSALGAEKPAPDGRIDVAAIYFPGYHRDTHYDVWFGEGWNEWTEGSVLLPDVKYQTRFLEEARNSPEPK